jgi:TonB family protein
MTFRPGLIALLIPLVLACDTKPQVQRGIEAMWAGQKPDELPIMLNKELPFRYPQDLYDQKVQGNVTLHIFIDTAGAIRPESTFVLKSSGYPALDSAAVSGSADLKFVPAKLKGEPLAIPILFPVHFRHPQGAPMPSDSAGAKTKP